MYKKIHDRYPISFIQYGNMPIRLSLPPAPHGPHPMPIPPGPGCGGPGVGWGGGPLWVYSHIGYSILDIYLCIYIHYMLIDIVCFCI